MKNDTLTITIPTSEYEEMKARQTRLELLVKYYEEQFRLSQHRRFGASSEKSAYDLNQISIFNEAEATAEGTSPEPELVEIEKHYRKRTRLTTDKLPETLPVETVEHDLPESERVCSDCGGDLHVMGRDSRRELVIIPAQVKIREHIRKIYACRNCEKNACDVPITKAPICEPVIKGSFASPESIAHIMTQKFVMGSPLYRQEQEFGRNGIHLSRQTMSNWLIKATESWLEPVYNLLHDKLVCRDVLHADETTLQVLREPGKTAQSKSYMWLYRTSGDAKQQIVLYDYRPDRKAKRPADFLSRFSGYLHADGYGGYHSLPGSITVVGCWAHVRRKFDEVLKVLPEKDREGNEAMRGKRYCDKLFALEREFSNMSVSERQSRRIEQAKPIIDEFFLWALNLRTIPKSGIGKAIYYAVGQRKYLERYLLDGRLEISNNRAERSIKPFVIDRKNFLFANTPRGAKASAIMFSLIETAKENGLNPYAYLTYIFENAPNKDINNDPNAVEQFMPEAVAKALGCCPI